MVVIRALGKVAEAKADAIKWAEENGITLTSRQYFEAAGVMFQIMQDSSVSTGIPKGAEPEDEGDDPND